MDRTVAKVRISCVAVTAIDSRVPHANESTLGDSGGPLIIKGGTAQGDVLVGITSW